MDTQNDGLEKADSVTIWPFLVSMLDVWKKLFGLSKFIVQLHPKRTNRVNEIEEICKSIRD